MDVPSVEAWQCYCLGISASLGPGSGYFGYLKHCCRQVSSYVLSVNESLRLSHSARLIFAVVAGP